MSFIKVDHLVFVVAIIVQSPGIRCNLNRVIISVAQEWFGFFWGFPVYDTQHTPVERRSVRDGKKKLKSRGVLPVARDAVHNSQVIQGTMLHRAFNGPHCTDVLQYVRDALDVSLRFRRTLWCLWEILVPPCVSRRQNVLQSRMEKLPLFKYIWAKNISALIARYNVQQLHSIYLLE